MRWILPLALALALPARAQIIHDAEAMLRGHAVWAGGFMESGMGELSGAGVAPTAVGLRYYERQGVIAGTLMGILTAAAAGVAASSPKSVERRREGNWVITKTTYRSAAEQKAITDAGAASAAAMASATNQSFDLQLYMRSLPGGGEASGYRMDMFFGSPFGDAVMLDVGLGWGSVDSQIQDGDRTVRLKYSYLGMPFRLNVAAGPVLLWGQWDWNWFGHGEPEAPIDEPTRVFREVSPFPIKLGAATNLFGRIYAEGVVSTPSYDSGEFGVRLNAGLRF